MVHSQHALGGRFNPDRHQLSRRLRAHPLRRRTPSAPSGPDTARHYVFRGIEESPRYPLQSSFFCASAVDDEQNYRTSLEMGHQFTTSSPTRPRVGSGDQGVPCANGQLPLAACPRTPYALGDLAIECTHHNASLAGEPATLTATEQKFLFELSANAGRALTHQQRLQRLWGSNHSSSVPLVPTAVRTPLIRTIPSPRVAEGISSQSLRRAPSSPDRRRPGSISRHLHDL